MRLYEKIVKHITDRLNQIQSVPVYLDDVMQSTHPFYFVVSVVDSATENVSTVIQNKGYFVDIALVDNKNNKKLVKEVLSKCGVWFSHLILDEQEILTQNYLTSEIDTIWHVQFTVPFPQYIEWSEK